MGGSGLRRPQLDASAAPGPRRGLQCRGRVRGRRSAVTVTPSTRLPQREVPGGWKSSQGHSPLHPHPYPVGEEAPVIPGRRRGGSRRGQAQAWTPGSSAPRHRPRHPGPAAPEKYLRPELVDSPGSQAEARGGRRAQELLPRTAQGQPRFRPAPAPPRPPAPRGGARPGAFLSPVAA